MTIVLSFLIWALSQQTGSAIEGVVVRDGTNQALVNVQVGLWPTSLEVKTDITGAYRFQGVPIGEYTLVVVHDGIKVKVPATMNVLQRLNVTLRVPPAPAISGTVYDPNGERLAAARVQAFRLAYTPTGQRLRSFAETITNDRGEYRFFWLRPGEYTIGASYSDREQASAADGLRLTSNLSKPDEGYPLVHSQSVDLRPGGEITNVNILLKEAPLVSVSGRLVDPEGKDACARLAVVPLNGAVNGDKDFGPAICGAFSFRVLPGAYSLLALGKGMASDVVPLGVPNRGIDKLLVELKKTLVVSGRLTLDGVMRPLTGVRVFLARDSPNIDQRILADMYPDGSFVVKDVGPGAFFVVVDPLPENTYVAGIRPEAVVGGGLSRAVRGPVRDVFAPIRFDEFTSAELNIQLSSAGGVAEGQVVDRAGKPVPGAQIVAAPVGFLRREDQFKVVTADAVGKFRVGGITPGSYRVYAFEELGLGAHLALTVPAIASQYINRGEIAAFTEGQSRVFRLVAIPASETAGVLR